MKAVLMFVIAIITNGCVGAKLKSECSLDTSYRKMVGDGDRLDVKCKAVKAEVTWWSYSP